AGGEETDAREFVGLDEAALELGAVRDVVEDNEAADLLHVLRNQRCDRDIEGRFTAAAFARRVFERELIQMMDTCFTAGSLQVLDQGGREELGESAAHCIFAADTAEALHLGVPAFHAIVEAGSENADI